MAIFWGVVLSCCITFPLTFGWLRFTLPGADDYQLWFFGLPLFRFPIGAPGLPSSTRLDYTAVLLIVGLAIAFWRRINDGGLLATQRFGFDLVPLVLLFAIAVTGLALTASSPLARPLLLVYLAHASGGRRRLADLAAVWQVLPHRRAAGEHRRDALPDGEQDVERSEPTAAAGPMPALRAWSCRRRSSSKT